MLVITNKEILKKIVEDTVPFFKPYPLSEDIKLLIEQNRFNISKELRNSSESVCDFKTDFTLINDTDYNDLNEFKIPDATKTVIIDIINRNIPFDDFKLVSFDFDIKRLYTDLNRFSILFKFRKNNLRDEAEELSDSLTKLFIKDLENEDTPFITSTEIETIVTKIIENHKNDISWIRGVKKYIEQNNLVLDEKYMLGFEKALNNVLNHKSTSESNKIERILDLITDTIEYQLNYGLKNIN